MKLFPKLTICFLSWISISSITQAQVIDDAYLSEVINQIKSTANLKSATAIAVVKDGRIIYEQSFGYAMIEDKVKAGPNTQFYIASATKPFTALNALIDAHNDDVSLSMALADMFPNFPLDNRATVTAKELLTHTASINNLPLVLATAYSGLHSKTSLRDMVLKTSEASSEPTGEFKYTNVGYNIYSIFSDAHFKKSWQEKLKHQIFTPAAMHGTTATYSSINNQSNVAKPYSLTSKQRNTALYLQKDDETMHAAGGVYATASDLGRFLIAELNQGMIEGKQVFPAEVIAQSQTKQVKTDTSYLDFEREGYAWGWYTGRYKEQHMLHHFGGFAGAHAHLSFMPDKKLGLVVLNNEDFLSSRLTSIIADYVYGTMLGSKDVVKGINARISELESKLAGLDNMLESQQQKLLSREWKLSRDAVDYVGEYVHPFLGSIYVTLNSQKRFDVEWGVMRSNSLGMNESDKIRVELDPTSGTVISFNISENVESLTYSGINFNKRK